MRRRGAKASEPIRGRSGRRSSAAATPEYLDAVAAGQAGDSAAALSASGMPEMVSIDLIDGNPFETRRFIDDASLQELADSIAAEGLLQNPVGRRVGDRVQLAFGGRRLLATRDRLGWTTLPVVIRDLTDREMFRLNVTENAQRSVLCAWEWAHAAAQCRAIVMTDEPGLTQSEMLTHVSALLAPLGKDVCERQVSRYLRVADVVTPEVIDHEGIDKDAIRGLLFERLYEIASNAVQRGVDAGIRRGRGRPPKSAEQRQAEADRRRNDKRTNLARLLRDPVLAGDGAYTYHQVACDDGVPVRAWTVAGDLDGLSPAEAAALLTDLKAVLKAARKVVRRESAGRAPPDET
jgi:ParB/RepB/Spo0J family partition protein